MAAFSHFSMTLATMRPRSLTEMPWSFAYARIRALRSRSDPVRAGRRRRPVSDLRARPMNGASCLRNVAVLREFRSISYSAPPRPKRTVWSAGPPSRSSSSVMVVLVAIPR